MMVSSIRVLMVRFFVLVVFASMPGLCLADNVFRHWTTASGQQSGTRLKLIAVENDSVRLQREDNGKVITMKLTELAAADRRIAQAANAKSATSPSTPSTGDWPQWRGPNRDGKSPAAGLIGQWPSDGPKLLWNITGLGQGYSTPAVVGDVVYVLGTRGDDELVFALSASDGSEKWSAMIGTKSEGGGFKGPKGTPTVDGEMLYAIGSDGSLACVDRHSGDLVWKKNLRSDFGGQIGSWDYAESPLIDGEKLICTPGGAASTLVALRKSNGSLIWKSPVGQFTSNDFARAGYASTISATIAGMPQYVAFLHGGVVGVSAKDGTPLWHYDSPANGTANCSTPVVSGDSVFAASAYGTGGGRAQIARRGRSWNVDEAYFVKKMENHHGGFVLHDGYIYGTNNSVLMCLDFNTGQIKWQDRCVGKGSVTMADGHLYVRGESGDVALVVADPNTCQEVGRFKQTDRSNKNAWAHPVVAAGKLYLHDQDRMLVYALK